MALSFQPFISSSPGFLVTQKGVRDRAAVGLSSVAWQGKAQQPDPASGMELLLTSSENWL